MRISQTFAPPLWSTEVPVPPLVKLTPAGDSISTVVKDGMATDPQKNNMFTRPLHQYATTFDNGTATILSSYANAAGTPLLSAQNFPSAAMVEWIGMDGLEELYIFFTMAWFDMGSWAWSHFVTEWGTKGVFQGERRFYLGPVVDDLYLGTGQWVYDGGNNEGTEVRMTGSDFEQFGAFQDAMNAQYGSDVIVEFAYNGNGVLEKVNSPYTLSFPDSDAGLLTKGDQVQGTGISPIHGTTWLSGAVPGMAADFAAGLWSSDDLMTATLTTVKDKFYWQSHTMSHLSRDNLGASDCQIEDEGNIALAKAMDWYYTNENFNWYSMVSPGITGLFNKYCLASGADQLMTCYPGDNTFVGIGTVSLVAVNRYHPLTTTVVTNGFAGMTIVPRFATFIYFNCVTADCLVQENEWIRRKVCGCSNLDPSQDKGTCSLCTDIQSFGSMANLIAWEKEATTRQILSGFRDKYMFHQANVVPTTEIDGTNKSLLQYWMEEMMSELTSFIDFPIKTLKFDHLCDEFNLHEALDNSAPLLKADKDDTGVVTSVRLDAASGTSGYIPLTVPSTMTVDVSSIAGGRTEIYGTDKTYYLATTEGVIVGTPQGAPTPPAVTPAPAVLPTPAPVTTSPVVAPTPAPVTVPPVVAPTPAPLTVPPVVTPTPAPVTTPPVVVTTPSPGSGTISPSCISSDDQDCLSDVGYYYYDDDGYYYYDDDGYYYYDDDGYYYYDDY
ncbi:unnamed protein product [Choristocarpus tenellus]